MVCFCSCCCGIQVSHAISVDRRSCVEQRNAGTAPNVMWSKIASVHCTGVFRICCSRCAYLPHSPKETCMRMSGNCSSNQCCQSQAKRGPMNLDNACIAVVLVAQSFGIRMMCNGYICIIVIYKHVTCITINAPNKSHMVLM